MLMIDVMMMVVMVIKDDDYVVHDVDDDDDEEDADEVGPAFVLCAGPVFVLFVVQVLQMYLHTYIPT